jgi:methylenetetrahydrofolate reductase (NADPH)
LVKFEKKLEAGAEFIQTQAIYDLNNFRNFMDYAKRFQVKILAGIVVLVSAGMAKFMNKNVPGIFVPKTLIDELDGAPKGKALETGINIAARTIKTIRDERLADGVHIMAIGKEESVPKILDLAGI